MSAYTSNGKRRSSMTHAKRRHICKYCQKVMHGNGYKNHVKACAKLFTGKLSAQAIFRKAFNECEAAGPAEKLAREDDLHPHVTAYAFAGAFSATDTTIRLREGEARKTPSGFILKNLRTGELMRVRKGEARDVVGVVRGYGGTVAEEVWDGDTLRVHWLTI